MRLVLICFALLVSVALSAPLKESLTSEIIHGTLTEKVQHLLGHVTRKSSVNGSWSSGNTGLAAVHLF
ncbi:unnamed protein product [Rhizopus stolonifer]